MRRRGAVGRACSCVLILVAQSWKASSGNGWGHAGQRRPSAVHASRAEPLDHRYAFLHPLARDVLDDWDEQARACVGRLRALAGTEPDAPDLAELVGELLAKSPDFADLWNRFDVKPHAPDPKTFHHPEVGDLHLGYESMPLEHSQKQRFVVFFAEPGTSDHDKLILLDAEHDELGLDVEEGRQSRRRSAD